MRPLSSSPKAKLRRQMRGERQMYVAALSAAGRAELQAGLARQVAPWLRPGATVGAYAVFGSEIDPASAAPGAAIPWFADAQSPMRFKAGPPTRVGPFGIAQPAGDAPDVEPEILLVPLLAAAPDGTRLGMGVGHYDRWLAGLPDRAAVCAIGCAWDFQLLGTVPADPWDMTLDAVATPTRFVRCR